MARHFLHDPDLVGRLRSQVVAGQREDATITAHTLKGAAGQMGALRVARLAEQIEQQLAQRMPTAAELEALSQALAEAHARVAALLPAAPAAAPIEDPGRIQALQAQLQQELEDDEDAAWDTCEALLAALPRARRDAHAPLGPLIANLEYDQALAHLRRLMAS